MVEIKGIVYRSKNGHSKKYALMLGRLYHLNVYTSFQAFKSLSRGSHIIFVSWVKNNKVVGLNSINNRYNLCACLGVGMQRADNERLFIIKNANDFPMELMFYAQGGYDPTKVHGLNKLNFMRMKRKLLTHMNEYDELSKEDLELKQMFKSGLDTVNIEFLEPLIEFLNNSSEFSLISYYNLD